MLLRFDFDRAWINESTGRRTRWSNLDAVRAAKAYVDAPTGARTRAVAQALRCSKANAAQLIYHARERGFLTGGGRGRAGGALTPRARRVLGSAA